MTIIKPNRNALLLFPVYLTHLSAVIGISIGHKEFFLPKSALNLALCFALLLVALPKQPPGKYLIPLVISFLVGMVVEVVGVHTGMVFGVYEYGSGLGPKAAGVPWIIGINWALLVFITFDITRDWSSSIYIRSVCGATLMVLLDLLIEQVAPWFGFWEFQGGLAGPVNYVAWWVVAFVLQLVIQKFNPSGNKVFSLHLFAVQLLFFAYFYVRTAL